jgi:hypothetical protein
MLPDASQGSPLQRLCQDQQATATSFFVIPGVTRNPVAFHGIEDLDAGSSWTLSRNGMTV